MAFVDWNSDYSVHDGEMDAHHQRLFTIVNDLHHAISTKMGKDELEKIIARLLEHTQIHFAAEERLMQERGYPRFAMHKAEHDHLLKQIGEIKNQFHRAHSEGATDMLAFLVKDWLVGHILKLDKDYAGNHNSIISDRPRQQTGA
ncbi:MAG: hemerythrin family protein [Sulfuricella sp.]|nr:hemerythrin family protein [Sulfuricella sp.]